MLEYLASSTEWLQQHAVHLLLRRKLAHLFENPVDLAQLRVQLRKHERRAGMQWSARLSNVQLSRVALSRQLVRHSCQQRLCLTTLSTDASQQGGMLDWLSS